MSLDLFHLVIVLDTSILRNVAVTSAPFQVLRGLIEGGLVKVAIPELAIHEFRTQWRDRKQVIINEGFKALKALSNEKDLLSSDISKVNELSESIANLDIEQLSQDFVSGYLNENRFEVIPLSFLQAKEAWNSYFIGNLPSKKIKHRADIPDAHIVASLKELAGQKGGILFTTSDKGQLEAAKNVEGVIAFDSLDAVIQSEQLMPLIAKWKIEEKWKAVQKSLSFEEVAAAVASFVQKNGGELLTWESVSDPSIPGDNHTASISMFGEPEEVEIDGPQEWGGGLLSYKVTYFSECLLDFQVFRGDAFDVPEWVSVSIGDFENDHYFEAEGYAVIIVEVDVTVKIKLDEELIDTDDRIEDISFETGGLNLRLASYN